MKQPVQCGRDPHGCTTVRFVVLTLQTYSKPCLCRLPADGRCTGWKLMDIEYGKELIDYPYCQLQE
jgi:hypothetical protein